MAYSVTITQSAVKALEKVAAEDRRRIIVVIDQLAVNPMAGSVLKGEFFWLRRIRVGNYRIVYEVREGQLMVLVVRIGHRREVCR
ncbi:MAG: type II toxin-antitoxin system RelE/ParE family toxin [Desulfurivibrionaceae bacterium]